MTMHPSVLQCLFVLSVAIFIFAYVSFRSRWNLLHWLLAGVMISLMMWALGESMRWLSSEKFFYSAGIYIHYYGIMSLVPLWVLLALKYARVRLLEANPQVIVLISAPSVIAYVALLTNGLHHLLIKDISPAAMMESMLVWAGPALWFFVIWSFFCGLGAFALYLGAARLERGTRERHRWLWIAAAAVLPLLMSGIFLLDSDSALMDFTPTALSISVLILFGTVFRRRLFEGLPIARRDVIEPLRNGVILADAQGQITDLNSAAATLLGCVASEVVQHDVAKLTSELCETPEARAEMYRRFQDLTALEAGFVFEVSLQNGHRIEFDAVVVRRENEVAGQYIVMRDRTEERRRERLFSQTQKLESVGSLVAGIAHEVNNPLAYVRSNLIHLERLGEIVQKRLDAFGEADAKQLSEIPQVVAETMDGVDRITKMVRGLRRFSHTSGDVLRPVAINQVLIEAIRLASLDEKQAIEVIRNFASDLPLLQGAPDRLGQVFLNLLLNAKHALRDTEHATIIVESTLRDTVIEVRITDNGPGIAADVQSRIFEPFFTTKSSDEGTGLGLAIASDIVHEHSGEIEVSSRPGQGARFTVRLPLTTKPAATSH